MRHVLVVANETVAGKTLLDALERRAEQGRLRVTVVAPQNAPAAGLVVYEESARSHAQRRLERTLARLREAGIEAEGEVVDPDPLHALRDALHRYRPDEVVISTHPKLRSRWLRGNVVDRARKLSPVPVEHVVVDLAEPRERAQVLVLANQTILGEPLTQAIRERAEEGPVEVRLVVPADVEGARARLERAVARLRGEGIDAGGEIGHPDPVAAAMNAVREEHADEIIVSTFPEARSGWLRRDVVGRIRRAVDVPVQHVVVSPAEAEAVPA